MEEPTRISPSLFWKCSHSQEELHSPRGRPPFEEGGSDGLGGNIFTFTFQCEAVQNRSAKSRREASQQVGLVSGRGAGLPEICSSHRPVDHLILQTHIRPGPQDDQNWVFAKLRLLWSAHGGYSVRPGAPPWGGWEGQACLESRRVQLGHSKQRFSQRIFSGESALGERDGVRGQAKRRFLAQGGVNKSNP